MKKIVAIIGKVVFSCADDTFSMLKTPTLSEITLKHRPGKAL